MVYLYEMVTLGLEVQEFEPGPWAAQVSRCPLFDWDGSGEWAGPLVP